MKRETGKVVEGTFGRMRDVEDFLPSPAELAQATEVVKVTIGHMWRRGARLPELQRNLQKEKYNNHDRLGKDATWPRGAFP